jgi:hypothetical protein
MIQLNIEPDANNGTDWIELSSIIEYPKIISKYTVEEYLSSLHVDDAEILTANIFKNIEWRSTVCKKYPFNLTDDAIKANKDVIDCIEYSFPLLLSTNNFFSDTKITDWDNVGNLFELYCAASLEQLLGDSLLIGNSLGKLPVSFDDCLRKVCSIINEVKGPKHEKANDFNDAGVDVISYRNIDSRKGKIIVLLQCASGKNWRKKGSDIKIRLWEQLVFWTAAPNKALAFPFAYDFDSPLAETDWIIISQKITSPYN